MNESDNQEILEPVVKELVPTEFVDDSKDQSLSNNLNSPVAVISPDDLGTVLTVNSSASLPGTTVAVPIAISDAEGLQSLTVNLTYDTSILNIVDPNPDTTENEAVRRAGISTDWTLEPNNPVANVNEETGEVSISLVNTQELPQADEEGNVPSGIILEIDFEVDADAELDSVANIDLQTARVGVNDQDIAVGDDNLADGDVTVGEGSTIELFRFRNTTFDTGTYVFVGEAERDAIQSNPDFNQTFALDGVQEDGSVNPAFKASLTPGEDLIPFYRIKSLAVPGTFLFVSTEEYDAIFAEGSDQIDQWEQEGLDTEGVDIPEFYLFDGVADRGVEFNRFQNTQNNTFLYAGPSETEAIEGDPNLSNLFNNQGIAFESLI